MAGFELLATNWKTFATAILGSWLIYLLSLAIYRLYLSPLAKIPGPKLAALTLWYEFYYDVVKQGRYTWRIREMHEKYGQIVRINPYEVHVNDPDYYNEIYTGPGKRRDKWAWSAGMFGNSSSFFGTIPHDVHRRMRAPLNPFFSKASIVKLEPIFKDKVEHLCSRFEGFRKTGEPVNIRYAAGAITLDIITWYAFGTSYNCLDEEDFAPIWPDSVDSLSEQSHLNKQMPWVLSLMRMTPLWIVERMNPHIMRLIRFQMVMCIGCFDKGSSLTLTQDMAALVSTMMDNKAEDKKVSDHQTIFNALLEPGVLPPEERNVGHLVDDAQSVLAAGQVTTTHYLNTTTYHIIANKDVYNRLKAELKDAMPDGSLPSLQRLEQLPFLTAVILEGYRISFGPTHRLQRVSPDEPLTYEQYVIPAGTPIGMTSMLIHENPDLFPEPRTFKPERWMEPGARQRLSNYLVNFSKGTRGCLGKELANAEIYYVLAALFSRYDFELYKTTRADIDVAHDFFNPQARKGSLGLRVLVH